MYKNLLNFGITHTPNIIAYKLYCMFTFIAMNTTQVYAYSNESIVVITVIIVAVAVALVLIAIAVETVIVEVQFPFSTPKSQIQKLFKEMMSNFAWI